LLWEAPEEIIREFAEQLGRLAASNDGQASEYAEYAIQKIAGPGWEARAAEAIVRRRQRPPHP
jgi:hypothetical protein